MRDIILESLNKRGNIILSSDYKEIAKEIEENITFKPKIPPSLNNIANFICNYFKVPKSELNSQSREFPYPELKHFFIKLSLDHSSGSRKQIAEVVDRKVCVISWVERIKSEELQFKRKYKKINAEYIKKLRNLI
jgi:chromosomal replication initiation ATPase DnaA